LILEFLAGLGAGVYLTPANALLSNVFPQSERGRAFGIHEAAVSTASMSATLLAVPLALAFNWRLPFFVCSALLLVAALLFAWLVKEPGQGIGGSTTPKVGVRGAFTGWFLALTVTDALGVGFCYNAFAAFMPTYLVNVFGVTLANAAVLVSVGYASGALGRVSCGPISDRTGRGRLVALLLTVTATSWFLFVTLRLPGLELIVLLAVMGFALNGVIPVLFALVADASPVEVRGTRFGFLATSSVGAGAISGLVVGYLADATGFVVSFALLGAVEIVSTLTFLSARKALSAATQG
jgi:MFS family permease